MNAPENLKMELTRWVNTDKADFISGLDRHVIWQTEAKEAVAWALFKAINSIVQKDWPIGVFLFAWPSGVGKTEMARWIAEELLGRPERLTKINCEALSESHMVSNLMGSPKGYVGYRDKTLLEWVGEHYKAAKTDKSISPLVKRFDEFSIILFDEIEKAHPAVHQSLLWIFDDGTATMWDGSQLDFSNSIIIMTTNIGEREIREIDSKPTMWFIKSDNTSDKKQAFSKALTKFSPEMIWRIHKVVHFDNLTEEDCTEIIKTKLAKLNQKLLQWCLAAETTIVQLGMTKAVYRHLVKLWYNKAVWARDLMRVFDTEINSTLGEILHENENTLQFPEHKALIMAEMKNEKIIFTLSSKNVEKIQYDVKNNVVKLLT